MKNLSIIIATVIITSLFFTHEKDIKSSYSRAITKEEIMELQIYAYRKDLEKVVDILKNFLDTKDGLENEKVLKYIEKSPEISILLQVVAGDGNDNHELKKLIKILSTVLG